MHWLKLLKNNLNQQLFKSKHLQVSYLEGGKMNTKPNGFVSLAQQVASDLRQMRRPRCPEDRVRR